MTKIVFKCRIRFINKNNKKMKNFKPTLKIYINRNPLKRNTEHNKDLMNLIKLLSMITAKKLKINLLNLIQ